MDAIRHILRNVESKERDDPGSTGFPLDSCGDRGRELDRLYDALTGFRVFDNALQFFPRRKFRLGPSLWEWNDATGWRQAFGDLIPRSAVCFAQDTFANQFCISEGAFGRIDTETGSLSLLADDLDEWAAMIVDDPDLHLGRGVLRQWRESGRALQDDHRLFAAVPIVCGGGFDLDNLVALESTHGLRLRGEIARQIAALPDGTVVQFRLVD